jgi:hypothetical protein
MCQKCGKMTTTKKSLHVLQNDYKHTGFDDNNYKINLAISGLFHYIETINLYQRAPLTSHMA